MSDSGEAMTGFEVIEQTAPDPQASRLFARCFRSPPPDIPRHFVVRYRPEQFTCGYAHFTPAAGVFLLGGLCVDTRVYRRLSAADRQHVAQQGSLSRWLIARSIALLGAKHAVFAYTGNIASRRDIVALGFTLARPPYLFVQWHDADPALRSGIVEQVARLGPF